MADEKKRLDESLSKEALKKSLEGTTGTRPALSRIQISPSGQVQPRPADSQSGASTSNSGSQKTKE